MRGDGRSEKLGKNRLERERTPCRERLRARRIELGLSIADCAEALGTTSATWRRYENGPAASEVKRGGPGMKHLGDMNADAILQLCRVVSLDPYLLIYGVSQEEL